MADTRMTQAEREAFLAEPHIGVLTVAAPDAAPTAAPIWYDYRPGGELWFITGPNSRKGRLLAVGGRATLVAQREALPYAYVTVEGTVTGIRPADADSDTRPKGRRYLGAEIDHAS